MRKLEKIGMIAFGRVWLIPTRCVGMQSNAMRLSIVVRSYLMAGRRPE
ncbi:hypothetical protein Mettu_0220 [Methylobacter tundripaludum SV96]|uniref:Uncharacterized protein n=1 Tax=Methylobacter tundripaludum (strain ATCC BAA-1195 / DSM 17260 / SV96) TaxID=697282 RepID=G3ITX6_METTV|nr:hypothetical protein Mettu_0220 [Methylobacter tundripaludum SV96]